MRARQPLRDFQRWQYRVRAGITFKFVCSSVFIAEFREDVRITIPAIAEHLKDSDSYVCKAAIEGLSILVTQRMC